MAATSPQAALANWGEQMKWRSSTLLLPFVAGEEEEDVPKRRMDALSMRARMGALSMRARMDALSMRARMDALSMRGRRRGTGGRRRMGALSMKTRQMVGPR